MTFARLLSEALSSETLPATGDILAVGLPLLRQLEEIHRIGMVSRLGGLDHLVYDGVALSYDTSVVQLASSPSRSIDSVNPLVQTSGVEVASRVHINQGTDSSSRAPIVSSDVYRPGTALDPSSVDEQGLPARPLFVSNYRAWEQLHGHHDPLTDIHVAGLLLVSYATGLDLTVELAVNDLALDYRQLLVLNPRLHPVVAGTLSEMIAPNRHLRPDSISQVIARLEHHRELPSDLDLSSAYGPDKPSKDDTDSGTDYQSWEHRVLAILRERVFDTSRRNRALYFRPTSGALSLTEASVPLLLDQSRIRPQDLLTWTGPAAESFRAGKAVDLGRWCRYDENEYLRPGLDRLISTERKLRAEHGQGRLHLIVAFLRWYDPLNNESVDSPLLVMPVELVKKKGVTDRYLVEIDQTAEVNPVLRHVLRNRFGMEIVESIDSDAATIASFVADLEATVRQSAPAVRIELVTKPRVDIIRRRAQLRVAAYNRRRAQALSVSGRWRRQDHSYDLDDWRPLGQALYRRFVAAAPLPLRDLTAAPPPPRSAPQMTDSDSTAERSVTGYALTTNQANQQRWEVDLCSVTLASLGSRRSTISRDYDALLAVSDSYLSTTEEEVQSVAINGSPFQEMFSPDPREIDDTPEPALALDQLLVLPADAAQAAAVRRGITGDSFIIQGPPGTGKSQTITNLIAGFVGEGKRVLFVCEKRAALDVVAHRLRQVGLDDLVATIHDSQRDRRAFIADLGHTYEQWLSRTAEADHDELGSQTSHATVLANTHKQFDPLRHLLEETARPLDGELSASHILGRVLSLRLQRIAPALDVPNVDLSRWLQIKPKLDEVVSDLERSGLAPLMSRHAGLQLRPSTLKGFTSTDNTGLAQATASYGRDLETATSRFVSAFFAAAMSSSGAGADGPVTLDPETVPLKWLVAIVEHRAELEQLGIHGSLDLMDPRGESLASLRILTEELHELDQNVANLGVVQTRWTTPFDATDTAAALLVAIDKEKSPFRIFNKRWRDTNRAVHAAYKFADHQVEPTVSTILSELNAFHQADQAAEALRRRLVTKYGPQGRRPEDLLSLVETFAKVPLLTSPRVSRIAPAETSAFLDAVANVVSKAAQLGSPAVPLDSSDRKGTTIGDLSATARALKLTPIALETALHRWSQLDEVDPALLSNVASGGSTPDEIELGLVEAAIAQASKQAGLGSMGGGEIGPNVERLLDSYQELLRANAKLVAHRAELRFTERVAFSESSMAGRSDEDKSLKRRYNSGRKTLEREFQKKMRFRSIRDLASGDSGLVVRDLKPVWLMSPLSVSDTLPLDDTSFDVVIFDEASQIPVEDAIPTMFRSRQVIVVGDRMQLPPTRFFSSDSDDEDEVVVDEDGHRLTLSLEADSFLTQADLALSSSMLTWHYRSRFESLIAYSNHAFYDARLATVPDRMFDAAEVEEIIASSAEHARSNLAATVGRPISFHKLGHGVYIDRRNEAEADYIAELVRGLLAQTHAEGQSPLTLGIVAFSQAQQSAIERSLEELALLDPQFGVALEAERTREDDGEFAGLFVKNLENVQGDERDMIIMSVCYAPGANGKLRMNFGPINQAGGERRLNVIFSRAKQHMAIVSSIVGNQITNTHNDGASNLARFLDYAAAESAGQNSVADGLLKSLRPQHSDKTKHSVEATGAISAAARTLADLLSDAGLEVETGVGRSVFQIDVAVRGADGYILGLLIDPDTDAGDHGDTAANRFVAEAGILKSFGWPIQRVLLSELVEHPEVVVARILSILKRTPA